MPIKKIYDKCETFPLDSAYKPECSFLDFSILFAFVLEQRCHESEQKLKFEMISVWKMAILLNLHMFYQFSSENSVLNVACPCSY